MSTPSFAWSLQQLQTWFLDVTTHPESAAAGVESRADLVSEAELPRLIRASDAESPLQRLGIYHRGYFSRHVECLADDYPALQFAVGDDDFRDICKRYAIAHPSHHPSLNGFGRHLPGFLRDAGLGNTVFLSELAQLEWSLVESLHARAPEPIAAAAIARIPAEHLAQLCFSVSDSFRLLDSTYPVNAYLQAYYDEEQPRIPDPQASHVAVVRAGTTVWRFDLDGVQALLLSRLSQGRPLGVALDGIVATPGAIQTWFNEWTSHGLFASVEIALALHFQPTPS